MSWENFKKNYIEFSALNFAIDLSRVGFPQGYIDASAPMLGKAFDAMAELEKGAIANPDENRMVGHYWLRAPQLAPTAEISAEIAETTSRIEAFAKKFTRAKSAGTPALSKICFASESAGARSVRSSSPPRSACRDATR